MKNNCCSELVGVRVFWMLLILFILTIGEPDIIDGIIQMLHFADRGCG